MKKAELRISIKTNGYYGYIYSFYCALFVLAKEICNPDLISGKRYRVNEIDCYSAGCEYINFTSTEIEDQK